MECLDDFTRITVEDATVFHGSNLDVLPFLADNSVDSIVTDPPYELGFMGKKWDSSGIAYSVELWQECLRVLKPGGHLLAFSGSRTYHRMVVAIEDAGFEVRDMIAWISNKTFPKSHNIGKATELDEWAGWGTALKPTVEPVVMARKPLIGTVAENVLAWGVGGLNIDASRIGTETRVNASAGNTDRELWRMNTSETDGRETVGRWPANIILDEYTAGLLDEQSGVSKPRNGRTGKVGGGVGVAIGEFNGDYVSTWPSDNGGGASRFFYVARASKRDRNEGLDNLPAVMARNYAQDQTTLETMPFGKLPKQNFHPTVKPTDLMRYLIKLVTPAGGTVLDPFTGSGSTGKAALLDGYKFVGVELTEEYLPIIQGRLEWANQQAIIQAEKESEKLF